MQNFTLRSVGMIGIRSIAEEISEDLLRDSILFVVLSVLL